MLTAAGWNRIVPGLRGLMGDGGVANYLGVLVGSAWLPPLAFCTIWFVVAAITRYSSLAALVASAATPVVLWWNRDLQEAQLFLLLTVLLWIMHAPNIARLVRGTEGKIEQAPAATSKR